MPSRLGIETALNIVVIALLLESYYRPPKGWVGGPMTQLLCEFVLCLAIVLLATNFFEWMRLYIKS